MGDNPVVCFADLGGGDLAALRRLARRAPRVRLIGMSRNGAGQSAPGCFATLPRKATPSLVRKTVDAAIANIELAQRERDARTELARAEREMEELNRIGIALSQTHEVGALLNMILTKAREITGADAGSLYLVEETRPDVLSAGQGDRRLRFKLTQNDSLQFPFAEIELPLQENSLAGYTALHGEVINLADARRIHRDRPYHFNPHFDEETGYHTRSMLTLPMKNGRSEVIGVLQLINCKIHPEARLTSAEIVAREVGLREDGVVRGKTLYAMKIDFIAHRFDYLYMEEEARMEREKVRILLEMDRPDALARIASLEEEYRLRRVQMESGFEAIVQANEPTVLPEGRFDRLFEIPRQPSHTPRGVERPMLTAEEIRYLSIPKGSLSPDERAQIESHVIHSFNFLLQIPWTKQIREIPRIVRAHHEKLNGTGYPYQLRSTEIPLQAKIMTICDIFDALSASDRPYKKAVASDRALNILEMSVKDKELDPELYRLFLEAKIFHLADKI